MKSRRLGERVVTDQDAGGVSVPLVNGGRSVESGRRPKGLQAGLGLEYMEPTPSDGENERRRSQEDAERATRGGTWPASLPGGIRNLWQSFPKVFRSGLALPLTLPLFLPLPLV